MAFATTRWSLVAAAGDDAPSALAELVEAYWYPLYAFARRQGADAEEAADRVQSFFAALIEKGVLKAADRERGRFRTFLLTAFRRRVAKERQREHAQKRGGDRVHLSLDFASGEERYRLEPAHGETPERAFERAWAHTLLERVMRDLEASYRRRGRGELFLELRAFLAPVSPPPSKAGAAQRLGMSRPALRVALHRLRNRYRDALRREIAETVAAPEDVDDEIRRLMAAVAL